IERITWPDFQKLVGNVWKPGINVPFDPVASKKAAQNGFTVIIASGANIENLINILNGRDFTGTSIVPGVL
ncbi:MAG: UMP kinase, partial [Spirochaetales bacterium]|nr:UMP kinase [Spirochaetales bacterium]